MKKHLKNLALLGFIVAGLIVGINKLINIISNANDNLPLGKGKFFNWKYGNVYYTKTGKGKPVLLIHDLSVYGSSYEWHKVIQRLSRTNTVYAIDLLGCGRSDKPNLTYNNFLYVQLINEFIKKVIGSKTNVVTTGASVAIAIMSCHMQNDNFDKIIAVSPSDIYDFTKTPGKRKNILKGIIDSHGIGTFIYNMVTNKQHVQDKLTDQYFFKPHLVTQDIINAYYKAAKNGDGHGKYLLASIKSHYTNINIIPAVEKINHSICLIGGKEHPFMNDIIKEYQQYNPAIEDAYVSNTSFMPQLESPLKFVELLNILLES